MKELNGKIIALLEQYQGDRKAILRDHVKLEYFMALSPMRENLLEWYEFEKDANLLQIGADFGALTGLFLRKTSSVTVWDQEEENLEPVQVRFLQKAGTDSLSLTAEPLEELAALRQFDYVVCAGAMREPVKEWTDLLKKLVKPGGTILLAVCNRFGLKYFAGAKRDEVSLTKNRLCSLFPGSTFYYPMPDYKVPSVIYSDQFLPGKGEFSGMHPLYDFPEYLAMDVGADFEAACEDGQFGTFADSFLIIWKKGE